MFNLTLPKMPEVNAEKLYSRVDALQSVGLLAAEKVTGRAVKRVPAMRGPLAERLPSLELLHSEYFNLANKLQSANRVFFKRVVLGEKPAAAKPAASSPVTAAQPAKATSAKATSAKAPVAKKAPAAKKPVAKK